MDNPMRKTVLIFVLLSAYAQLYAQRVPGYRGHKLSLSYDFIFDPAINIPLITGEANNTLSGDARVLYSHSVSADYTFNRRAAVGLSYQFFALGNPTLTYQGNAKVLSLYIKRFRQSYGAIAPLGKYIKPEITLMLYSEQFTYSEIGGITRQSSYASSPHIGFNYSIGKTSIIFNHILLDRGVRLSLNNVYTYTTRGSNTIDAQGDPAAQEVMANQIFNFYLGMGLVL
jgi:hypothetical protein